jgi:hypothetical protein
LAAVETGGKLLGEQLALGSERSGDHGKKKLSSG